MQRAQGWGTLRCGSGANPKITNLILTMTIDRFITLCLTTTAYVSVFLILMRAYEWYATGYWNWAPMVLGTGTMILLLFNGGPHHQVAGVHSPSSPR